MRDSILLHGVAWQIVSFPRYFTASNRFVIETDLQFRE